jgi:methyl-accepting chemotaxis protein
VEELYSNAIKFTVTYLRANQGGLFLIEGDDDDQKIRLVSCYAYEKKKFMEKVMDMGSGLVGQCILEKETIYLTDIPGSYVHITSGLGGSNPNAIIIVPLKANDQVYGAIEVASFTRLKAHEISFLEKIAESIASTVGTAKGSERTKELVEQLQQQTEEMKSQEEEMRQNMEELSATQEEMIRKEREYIARIQELEQA